MNIVARYSTYAAIGLLVPLSSAYAQSTTQSTTQTSSTSSTTQDDVRPAMTTVRGDTGLWYVPTAEVLPVKKWSFSLSRLEKNEGEGFTNISSFPVSFGVGVAKHLELFGSWDVLTRIDRDSRPLYSAQTQPGTGGGTVVDFPLTRSTFESERGDLWLGGKLNFMSQADHDPVAMALRVMVKVPVGNDTEGTSSGKMDSTYDLVISGEKGKTVELSAFGGLIVRGNPAGFTLTNGLRWGVGAAFPSRSPVRLTTELYGENYFDKTIFAPAGFTAEDGSIAPLSTVLKNPTILNVGLTFQNHSGWFVGVSGNWNLTMNSRQNAGIVSDGDTFDAADYQVRIGFHPGVRKFMPPPPPPPTPAPVATAPPAPAPRANRPPTVKATCDPCTVLVGQTSTVTADGQDPDGDTLTYQWRTAQGSLTSPTSRQSPWTAPMQVGRVPVTVSVDDGHGGTASDTVNIDVVKPAIKSYSFEDVHFEFDRYNLRPDALRTLDEAVTAMQADNTLKLTIEGHTCDIGTAEYNLALGQRRADAVREYITSRGISADRLKTVSYGEEEPKFDNSREETRRLNRRAALVVRLDGSEQ